MGKFYVVHYTGNRNFLSECWGGWYGELYGDPSNESLKKVVDGFNKIQIMVDEGIFIESAKIVDENNNIVATYVNKDIFEQEELL